MKKACLLFVLPALLVALAFAQTPAGSINTDQTNIKGCLGGADPNYTVVEDSTGKIFKVTTSSVDLKAHLGHDVTLTGQKASGVSSDSADNSFAVTELKMISEHCAAAAAVAPAATLIAPSETPSTPATAASAPVATIATPPETTVTPATGATAPAATSTPPAETAATPAVAVTPGADATAPASPSVETTVTPPAGATPAADATPPAPATPPSQTRATPAADAVAPVSTVTPSETAGTPAAHHRKQSATPAGVTTTSAVSAGTPPDAVSTPAAAATTPAATAGPSPDAVSTPAPAAATPTSTSRGWPLWLAFGVLILVLGTTFPFLNRWRKQRRSERTGAPNLSLVSEASPDLGKSSKSDEGKRDQDKSDPAVTRKAA
jgi:hypothetical protein